MAEEESTKVNGSTKQTTSTKPEEKLLTSEAQEDGISADEVALYDRQIRLWGVQAQLKIQTAKILLVSLRGLANEIAKNLVLAGVGSLTVVDHEVVTEEDLFAQFFVTEGDVGRNRAEAAAPRIRQLNPRVSVQIDTSNILDKPPEFYSPFSIVIATDIPFATLNTINAAARLANRSFYAAGSFGLYGFLFADLISHEYIIEREKPNIPTVPRAESSTRTILTVSTKKESGSRTATELVTKREVYSPLILANTSPLPPEYTTTGNAIQRLRRLRRVTPLLPCLRALWDFQARTSRMHPEHSSTADLRLFTTLATEKHRELQLPADTLKSDFLRSFLMNVGTEMAPVAAFVGGMLAQDVINVLGQREQPVQNLMLFDGDASVGPVYAMHPLFAPEINAKVAAVEKQEVAAMTSAVTAAAAVEGNTLESNTTVAPMA